MKTNLFFAACFVALASLEAGAQSKPTLVGIVPGGEPGLIKLIYARHSADAVTVRFINDDGIVATDRIGAGKLSRGFQKKYDVSRIQAGDFWIELRSGEYQVRYKVKTDEQGRFVPTLEKQADPQSLVASNN